MTDTTKSARYSISLEILHAIFIGIGFFICGCLVVWLGYSFVKFIFVENSLSSAEDQRLLSSVGSMMFMAILTFFWMCMWFFGIALISLVQFVAIAVPLAKIMSTGIKNDASRSLIFYVFMGAVIGGGPWWIQGYFLFDSKTDLGSLLLVLAPGLLIGIFAGVRLKFRLVKLAKHSVTI